MTRIFDRANLLIPRQEVDLEKYSVIACDQFTSQPEYWETVRQQVQGAVSTYHMIFPEVYLKQEGTDERIERINQTMQHYLTSDCFDEYQHSLVYVERTLGSGLIRRGLIGRIDLEQYDYKTGAQSMIRATEHTVVDRIPPRVRIRKHAPLELPHVMLLMDDAKRHIVEPLAEHTKDFTPLYDFGLMGEGGHLCGWKLDEKTEQRVLNQLEGMRHTGAACHQNETGEGSPMLFAVGDGNHSLAAAKSCYEQLKQTMSAQELQDHPARYALVELVNLHDTSLQFEPIHRVVFDVDPHHLLRTFCKQYQTSATISNGTQTLEWIIGAQRKTMAVVHSDTKLAVATLQSFLDDYVTCNGGTVDYIHGTDVVSALCQQRDDCMGCLLPPICKQDLFSAVMQDGALPRKTFSMGEAWDKRFYLEARKIR